MARILIKRFDDYKKQGLSDDAAMKKAMADQVAATVEIRKADATKRTKAAKKKKKKKNWVKQLKEKVQTILAGKDTAMKKRYLAYYRKTGPGKRTLSYVQWLKDQKD